MAEKETSKMLKDVQKMQFDSPYGKDLADIVRIGHVVGLFGDDILFLRSAYPSIWTMA